MLPRGSRIRRRQDFTLAVRRGRRVGRHRVVVYLYERSGLDASPRVGFIVGKAVGGAVVRNRVRRQLRHLVQERTHRLPAGSLLVVRASRPAAGARSWELARELDSAFERLLRQQTRVLR